VRIVGRKHQRSKVFYREGVLVNTIKTLIQQCEKITDPKLSVDDLYINLKYLRETIQAAKEDVDKDEIKIVVSGNVGVGKTAVTHIISMALQNADIECYTPDLELEYNQLGVNEIENANLSNLRAIITEEIINES